MGAGPGPPRAGRGERRLARGGGGTPRVGAGAASGGGGGGARAGQGTAPQARGVFRAPQEVPTAPLGRAGRPGQSTIRAGRGGGRQPPGGTRGAAGRFVQTPRPLARPRGRPVARAQPGAPARPLQGAARAPWARGAGAPRRWRGGANAQGTLGGRPARGRSPQPCLPWGAQRETPCRRAAAGQASASETGGRRWPLTRSRTAWARRPPRAARGGWPQGAQGGSASWGKGSGRGRR